MYATGTHVHGHWEVDQKRLDITIHGTYPQPDAHGIVGQSYRDAVVRHGKLDEYGIDEFGNTNGTGVDSEGMLPPMTTSAQVSHALPRALSPSPLRLPYPYPYPYPYPSPLPPPPRPRPRPRPPSPYPSLLAPSLTLSPREPELRHAPAASHPLDV
jgi:hypothetical protein